MKLYIALVAMCLSFSASADELAKLHMDNDSYVVMTSLNCPFSKTNKPRFAYVVNNNDDVVADACWTIVGDTVLVVTRSGEVGRYPLDAVRPEKKYKM